MCACELRIRKPAPRGDQQASSSSGYVPLVEPRYTCRQRDSEELWVHVAIGSENPEEPFGEFHIFPLVLNMAAVEAVLRISQ